MSHLRARVIGRTERPGSTGGSSQRHRVAAAPAGAYRRGTTRLREVAECYAGTRRGPGSEAEADFLFDFLDALAGAGIERPELPHVIEVRQGTERLVPDFTWPRRRKVIEMKGLEAHGDSVIQDEDNEREADIRAAGWDLTTVTPRAMRERPARTIARLLEFLGTPAPQASTEPGAPDHRIGRSTRPEPGEG